MGDLYVCAYVRMYVLRNVDRNVAGFLPANWAGLRGPARARWCENYNLEKQISGRAHGAPGLAELEQPHNLWSQTVDIK